MATDLKTLEMIFTALGLTHLFTLGVDNSIKHKTLWKASPILHTIFEEK
jgi:hypothetical protein